MAEQEVAARVNEIIEQFDGTVLTLIAVMQRADDDESVLVAYDDCTDWISIPLSKVRSLDLLGSAPCDDHEHPLVKITVELPLEADTANKLLVAQHRFYRQLLRRRPSSFEATEDDCSDRRYRSCFGDCIKNDGWIQCAYYCLFEA